MDFTDFQTWTNGARVIVDAPHIVFPLFALVSAVVWWVRGVADKSQVEGLKAHNDALKERLSHAKDKEQELSVRLQTTEGHLANVKLYTPSGANPRLVEATANATDSLSIAKSTSSELDHILTWWGPPGTNTIYLDSDQHRLVTKKPTSENE